MRPLSRATRHNDSWPRLDNRKEGVGLGGRGVSGRSSEVEILHEDARVRSGR